jgi:hypothetical protein
MKFLSLSLLLLLAVSTARALEVHVSPAGNDLNPGTNAAPWQTLEGTRDQIRAWRRDRPENREEAVTIWVHGGTYFLERTFELTREDGGTANAPVTWAAYGRHPVRFSGGRDIPSSAFGPVRDSAALQRLRQPLGLEHLAHERDAHHVWPRGHRRADLESRIAAELHVLFPLRITCKTRLAIARVTGRGRPSLVRHLGPGAHRRG